MLETGLLEGGFMLSSWALFPPNVDPGPRIYFAGSFSISVAVKVTQNLSIIHISIGIEFEWDIE